MRHSGTLGVGATPSALYGLNLGATVTGTTQLSNLQIVPNATFGANNQQVAMIWASGGTVATGAFTGGSWYGMSLQSPAVTGSALCSSRTMLYLGGTPNVGGTNYAIQQADGGAISQFAGQISVTNGTASSSLTTGAVVVTGGIGATGSVWSGGFNGPIGAGTANTGKFTTLTVSTGSLTFSTAGQGVVGITGGATIAAGVIGETIVGQTLNASAVTLTNAGNTNITSVTLTPGKWAIHSRAGFQSVSSAAPTNLTAGLSTTSGSGAPSDGAVTSLYLPGGSALGTNGSDIFGIPTLFVNITTNTTYYLVAYVAYTGGSMTGWGTITGQRIG